MAASPSEDWKAMVAYVTRYRNLGGILGLLEWDQQVCMSGGSAGSRGAQVAELSKVRHAALSDPRCGDLARAVLGSADADLGPEQPSGSVRAAAARAVLRDHSRAAAVPAVLVDRAARARTAGFTAWNRAREAGQFHDFAPALAELTEVARAEAACHSVGEHLYDGALEGFDPGARVASLTPMFRRLGTALVPLVQAARNARAPDALALSVPEPAFERLNRHVLDAMGYDFERGRLDLAAHPFTVGVHPNDVRITTRLLPDAPLGTLGATIHEGGHALYEQGLPVEWFGTGLCRAAGAGLHESQSRFWENQIGRSRAFFRWLCPAMEEACGHTIDPDALYRSANRIEPTFVRVEADEATYNLHVIIRYELELALFEERLSVAELPDAWNAAYAEWLGLDVTDPRQGVLQDIHWACGLFGYFPSYTIGNLYAAGFGKAIAADMPDLLDRVEVGDLAPILRWLRERVHSRGCEVDAPTIFQDAVGDCDPVEALIQHLYDRQGALYGISRPIAD
ncbi:MAG: carboxypeptidase [Deltaproteobacteria bacterium]|nr:carboxypeptidase [Deltaproteobacteria bacterium]HCH61355.1 carboxypeptidase [Deltaproteobacteria bacterium]